MDRLTAIMVRFSLSWLLIGFVIGGLMLIDRVIPGSWRVWMGPTHGHILFVGWFLQFVMGIAFWLLPRKRSPERPLGYNERLAMLGAGALNFGLLLRVITEPLERIGEGTGLTIAALAVSSVLQVGAVLVFILQLWPRITIRQVRSR